ncbi:MAG: hypothetical protein VX230_02100 [Candidatus Thermoplasmatota archaeon]|nr:hypothetical protein [Candidatus Thermoplasmatota archaeon]
MMVRIMSLLPFGTGSLCLLIVLVSFFGFASGTIDDEIPALPCVGAQEECATGMSESDLDVPTAFLLLDVQLDISMELDDAAWIGIVDSKYAITCPPGDTGLTNCTSSDYTFLAGGPNHEGTISHNLDPGSVRFVTGGDEGAVDLRDNTVTTEWSVHLATWVEAVLGMVGIGLCASGVHMAFPMVAKARKD